MNNIDRPKLMTVTDAAAARIQQILADKEGAVGLRVGLKQAGCAGLEYTMDFAEAANPGEEVVEDNGVTIFVDPKAVLYLIGTELDFKTEKLSARFVFNNPNEISACGCGESVTIKPVG
ncbi:MAG: iron-sulfur cluster assembly accessory protein [Alphaproteobacteria bacterium]